MNGQKVIPKSSGEISKEFLPIDECHQLANIISKFWNGLWHVREQQGCWLTLIILQMQGSTVVISASAYQVMYQRLTPSR
jgi:hypothetical protein